MKSLSGKPYGLDNIDVVTMAEWPILFVLFGQAKYILLDVVNWVLTYLEGSLTIHGSRLYILLHA